LACWRNGPNGAPRAFPAVAARRWRVSRGAKRPELRIHAPGGGGRVPGKKEPNGLAPRPRAARRERRTRRCELDGTVGLLRVRKPNPRGNGASGQGRRGRRAPAAGFAPREEDPGASSKTPGWGPERRTQGPAGKARGTWSVARGAKRADLHFTSHTTRPPS